MVTCEECRGACCERFALKFPADKIDPEIVRWLDLHGTRAGEDVYYECRCSALTPDGRCGIYESRPLLCVKFEVGGSDCIAAIAMREKIHAR